MHGGIASISMMTMKPSAFISKASVPGMARRRNASSAAWMAVLPVRISYFQALVICTACRGLVEKIKKGTRMDAGHNNGLLPIAMLAFDVVEESGRACHLKEIHALHRSSTLLLHNTVSSILLNTMVTLNCAQPLYQPFRVAHGAVS